MEELRSGRRLKITEEDLKELIEKERRKKEIHEFGAKNYEEAKVRSKIKHSNIIVVFLLSEPIHDCNGVSGRRFTGWKA
ncbi:MAG: hypothetical protein QXX41_14045 [Nitrososphaerota archaeon]